MIGKIVFTIIFYSVNNKNYLIFLFSSEKMIKRLEGENFSGNIGSNKHEVTRSNWNGHNEYEVALLKFLNILQINENLIITKLNDGEELKEGTNFRFRREFFFY